MSVSRKPWSGHPDRELLGENSEGRRPGANIGSRRTGRRGALWLMLLLLSGCAAEPGYRFVPPTTAAGQSCVAQCDETQQRCQSDRVAEVRECESRFERALRDFDGCRRNAFSPGAQGACVAPRACSGASDSRCVTDYRACYTQCGGTVETVTPTPVPTTTPTPTPNR
jgi:hypothetical protein